MNVVDAFSVSKTTKISFEFSYKTLIKLIAKSNTNKTFISFKVSTFIDI